MCKTKEAQAFLKQLKKLDKMIENKMIEKQQWMSIAMGTTSGGQSVRINGVLHNMEKVQSSGSQQKMADAVVKYVEIEREIDRCIDNLVDAKYEVISVIERLNIIEYDLLHKMYVQHFTLYEIAEQYGKTYTWATTVHGRALKSVQMILDERKRTENNG
jgi:hypothetical protein